MIRKLRIRFIALAFCSLLLVLLATIVSINLMNYRRTVKGEDRILDVLVQHDGAFPKVEKQGDYFEKNKMSRETPFESRFFLVAFNKEMEVEFADTGQIAAVDEEMAISYGEKVLESGRSRGFLSHYRYRVQETEHGTMVVFLDSNRGLRFFTVFLINSCVIALLVLVSVFGLIYVFSGKLVNPVAESYEKQKRFITDAGHEIKTPLTIIDADIDVLAMDIGENEWLEDMKKQTKRLVTLTNDLIYLSRMEEDRPKIQMLDLPFSDIAEETAQSFQALAVSQEKSFSLSVRPMLVVNGDEKALRELISVLLDNAIKYSGKKGTISFEVGKSGRTVQMVVYNSCEWISKEDLSHLFERFYRADKSRNSEQGGYGIGLSIAKAITEAHHGEIHAATADEHSLKITVSLPAVL